MSEQDGTQVTTEQRRSRQKSKQNGMEMPVPQRPANDDQKAWREYWVKQGQPWRTEPEIDEKRQTYLEERRAIIPDIEQGIYPFRDIKLGRADVEWLLATHEDGRGPIFSSGDSFRTRRGLDLRGADLCQANLRRLPLAFMRGSLFSDEWHNANEEQRNWAAILVSEADLSGAHLERADLRGAHLEGASLVGAHLVKAGLRGAHLEGSTLEFAHLSGAGLTDAKLSDKNYVGPPVVDTDWGDANLSLVKWSQIKMLGDEYKARQSMHDGKIKDTSIRLSEYERAVRANRRLAVALQGQGLNEIAARFVYHAQLMQRKVFRYQRKFGQYLFSCFLDLLAGYGYKPSRSFIAYLLVITAFATAYFIIGRTVGPALSPIGAWVFSMTSFHGRGFFPGGIGLDDPLTVLAALEAFVGLLIEVTFIATLTQRLFGR